MDQPDNLPALQQDVDPSAEFLKQVAIKEAECLDRILTRFCLLNGLPINISKVEHQIFEGRDNYYELFYIGPIRKSKNIKHFLMSRDLKIVPGQTFPVLEIKFNPDLLKEED